MSKFSYRACDASGKSFSGWLEADNTRAAVKLLRQRGLWVTKLSVAPARTVLPKRKISWRERWQLLRLPSSQLAAFYRQISVLLTAGLPVHEALRVLSDAQPDSAYRNLLQALFKDLLAGRSLSDAMSKQICFSAVTIQLVRAGEAGGSLEQIFQNLADYQEKTYQAREKLKSLLLYPLILFATTAVAFVFLTLFILPAFASMLSNLSAELPLPTKLLLNLSAFLQTHGFTALIFVGSFLLLSLLIGRQTTVRKCWAHYSLLIPLLGRLQLMSAWLLILHTFTILLRNGLPVHHALRLAGMATDNLYLQEQLARAQDCVESGKTLSYALAQIKVFPKMLWELLQAGEASGMLEEMAGKAAEFCAVQVEQQAKRLEALAEPVALFCVGTLIFFFVLAIVLPLLGTMDVLG